VHFEPPRRRNPVLGIYRWRYEIALVGVVAALVYLGQVIHWSAPLALVFAVVLVLATWPEARSVTRDRVRSVVVQHRLRTAFHELGLTTWGGRAPAILWTSPHAGGVGVHLACPAGIGAGELGAVRGQLAAACYASDVLVERHPRYANVVVLLVVTRVPAG
jgi:hypothetical protein